MPYGGDPPLKSAGDPILVSLWNTYVRNSWMAVCTALGLVKHEAGGLEVDVSAVAKGDLITGLADSAFGLLGVGTNGQVPAADSTAAAGIAWKSQGLVLQGQDATERTCTNSDTSLSSVAGLSIPTTAWVLIVVEFRATAGTANAATLGLRINATDVTVIGQLAQTEANDAAKSGVVIIIIGPQSATYLRAFIKWYATSGAGTSSAGYGGIVSADMPNATITDVIIRGNSNGAGSTLGTNNLRVYTM